MNKTFVVVSRETIYRTYEVEAPTEEKARDEVMEGSVGINCKRVDEELGDIEIIEVDGGEVDIPLL